MEWQTGVGHTASGSVRTRTPGRGPWGTLLTNTHTPYLALFVLMHEQTLDYWQVRDVKFDLDILNNGWLKLMAVVFQRHGPVHLHARFDNNQVNQNICMYCVNCSPNQYKQQAPC